MTPTFVYFEQVLAEVDRDIARLERELASKKAWRLRVREELERRRQRIEARKQPKPTIVIRRKQAAMT